MYTTQARAYSIPTHDLQLLLLRGKNEKEETIHEPNRGEAEEPLRTWAQVVLPAQGAPSSLPPAIQVLQKDSEEGWESLALRRVLMTPFFPSTIAYLDLAHKKDGGPYLGKVSCLHLNDTYYLTCTVYHTEGMYHVLS